MSDMKIDFKKLLGYRLVADSDLPKVMAGAKTGGKTGGKPGVKVGVKVGNKPPTLGGMTLIGGKIGGKDGRKPV